MSGIRQTIEQPHLEGVCNFRDVGGAPTTCGGAIRQRVLFRSDSLESLTLQDCDILRQQLGIRSVIDLRSTPEASGGRSPLSDVAYLSIPLLDVGEGLSEPVDGCLLAREYAGRLRHDANLPKAIEALATTLTHPVIVHCAGGKDRTGIVIALALALAGATNEAIIADYMLTARNLPRLMLRLASRKSVRRQLPPDMYECPREAIEALLLAVDELGGAEWWARGSGIHGCAIEQLRSHLSSQK